MTGLWKSMKYTYSWRWRCQARRHIQHGGYTVTVIILKRKNERKKLSKTNVWGWMQEKNSLCGSKNYPYLHSRDFFLNPHLSGNSSQASYIYLNLWGFENPPPPRNFQSLLWGEYGYFLELHIKRTTHPRQCHC